MKTENLPSGTSQTKGKYVPSPEGKSDGSPATKQPLRLAVGDVISVKIEQILAEGRALVSFEGARFTALTQIALKQGEVLKALVESLGSEVKLKPLLSQAKLLEQKLTGEVKSLIGDKASASDSAKWVKNLVSEAKGEIPAVKAAAPQTTAGQPVNQAATLQPQNAATASTAIPNRTELAVKAEAVLNMLKNGLTALKEGGGTAAPQQTNAQSAFSQGISNIFTQAKYQQMVTETAAKTEKPLDLGALLTNDKAGPILRENVALLEKIMERTLLNPENKATKETLMNQMRDSGLQLERKIADLIREGAHHEFPRMAEKDLKGQLLKLKGELQQMSQDKTLKLPANVREEIAALHKEVSSRVNNIELNQVLNTISRDKDNSMIFQIPFLQNEEIKNSVLQYKRKQPEDQNEPEELAISFFLEMSNIGQVRIDGLLKRKNFNGVIKVTNEDAALTLRQNIPKLAQSIGAYGIVTNFAVKKVEPQSVLPPENTDYLKSDEFRDSILDLKV